MAKFSSTSVLSMVETGFTSPFFTLIFMLCGEGIWKEVDSKGSDDGV
jgi:hypothetical protein